MTNFAQAEVSAGDQGLAAQFNGLREDVIRNAGDFSSTSGSANAYVLAIDAIFNSYGLGDTAKFKASFTNSGACTININSLGAKSIVHQNGAALAAGDIKVGGIYTITYSTSQFVLTSTPGTYNDLMDGTSADGLHIHTTDAYAVRPTFNLPASAGSTADTTITPGFESGIITVTGISALNNVGTGENHQTWAHCIFDGTTFISQSGHLDKRINTGTFTSGLNAHGENATNAMHVQPGTTGNLSRLHITITSVTSTQVTFRVHNTIVLAAGTTSGQAMQLGVVCHRKTTP